MASLISVDAVRCWRKLYPSKQECVNDLNVTGLITILERDEVLESDFDFNDKVVIFRAVAEAKDLENVGFLETTREKLN